MRFSKRVPKKYLLIYLKLKTVWILFKQWNELEHEFLDRILKSPYEEYSKCDDLPTTAEPEICKENK